MPAYEAQTEANAEGSGKENSGEALPDADNGQKTEAAADAGDKMEGDATSKMEVPSAEAPVLDNEPANDADVVP